MGMWGKNTGRAVRFSGRPLAAKPLPLGNLHENDGDVKHSTERIQVVHVRFFTIQCKVSGL